MLYDEYIDQIPQEKTKKWGKKRLKQTRIRGMYFLTGVCIFQIYINFWLETRNCTCLQYFKAFVFISFPFTFPAGYVPTFSSSESSVSGWFPSELSSAWVCSALQALLLSDFFFFPWRKQQIQERKKKGGEEEGGRERLQCVQIVLQSRKTAEVVLQSALRKHGTHTGCESPVARVTVQKKAKCIWDSLFNQFLFHEVKSQ